MTPPLLGSCNICTYCGRHVKVTLDGRAKRHGIKRVRYRALNGAMKNGKPKWIQKDLSCCEGTGKKPREFKEGGPNGSSGKN